MPPKQSAAKISAMAPKAHEIAKARSILSKLNPKEVKAKFQSMANFEKQNPDADLKNSRGELRQKYLLNYLVHQMRDADARKEMVTTNKFTVTSTTETKDFEWSTEQMDINLGVQHPLASSGEMIFLNNWHACPCSYNK